MQTGSSNYTQAASAGELTRTPVSVYADWAQDGYGGSTSIDNLSGYAGSVRISHGFDDGLPDPVHRSTSEPVAAVELGPSMSGDPPSRYFSPLNASSPYVSYDRDVAPVRIKSGLVTAGGQEEITVFTGQMANLPVGSGKASLEAMSAARLLLTKVVTPPAITNVYSGLTATWPVSWALAQCGIYASPPPRAGCFWWAPMHGSGYQFLPFANSPTSASINNRAGYGFQRLAGEAASSQVPLTFINGPWVSAAYGFINATGYRGVFGQLNFWFDPADLAADLLSQAGNKGRIEFYVRGDAFDLNATPGGSGGWADGPVSFTMVNINGTYGKVGIGSDRKVYVKVFDGTSTVTVKAASALPTNGLWYSCGGAWDIAAATLWTFFDGTVGTNTGTGLTTAGLPATQDWTAETPDTAQYTAVLPFAELQITVGSDASPTSSPLWNGSFGYFTATAQVTNSPLTLEALIDPPTEAYELILKYARGEMAWTRFDETDKFLYFGRSYWALTAQQTSSAVLDTLADIGDLVLVQDPRMIVNSATARYSQVRVGSIFNYGTLVYTTDSVFQIPPGTTSYLTVGFDSPIADLSPGFVNGTAATVTAGRDTGNSWVTINSQPDGSGGYALTSDVTVSIFAWSPTQMTIRFVNHTGLTWYVANSSVLGGSTCPTIGVYGVGIEVTDATTSASEPVSIAARGERAVVLDVPAVQTEEMARAVATWVVLGYARPTTDADGLKLFADARRQPGDLVTVRDLLDTGANGTWRVVSVDHNIDGADYTQTAKLTRAFTAGRWGTAIWGRSLWSNNT